MSEPRCGSHACGNCGHWTTKAASAKGQWVDIGDGRVVLTISLFLLGNFRYVRYRTERNSSTDYALRAIRTNATAGVAMDQTPNELWLSFKALADTYPRDEGVRITAHLARWLVEERRRFQIPIPAVLQRVVEAVVKEVTSADSPRRRQPPVISV